MDESKRIVVDIDGVVARGGKPYPDCVPYPEAVRCLRLLKEAGYVLVMQTARYMAQFCGDQEMAIAAGRPELVEWLDKYEVPYDEVYLGKASGFIYLDDRAFKLQSDLGAGEWTRLMNHLGQGELNAIAGGDVVELKSGGPSMTVTGFDKGRVTVSYFDLEGELIETNFPPDSLSVTERRWEGLTEEEVSRAAAQEEDEDSVDEDDEDD